MSADPASGRRASRTPRLSPRAAAALGVAAAAALLAALARAPRAVPGPGRARIPAARPTPTPTAAWQPLVDVIVARALDGDALIVVERTVRGAEGRAVARAVAEAAAAAGGGPRLAIVDALPSTAAAAANRLAAALAAPRVWVAWPAASVPPPEAATVAAASSAPLIATIATIATTAPTTTTATTTTTAATAPVPPPIRAAELAVPFDDPVRAWLDANGRPVDARVVGAGAGAWVVGAWEHVPSLDGGDYPPVVVPEPLGALELVGWSIAPLPLRTGRAGRVRAAWKVGRGGAAGVRIAFRLVDRAGRVVDDFGDPPALRLVPVEAWPEADITVASHDFTVSDDLPAGAYDVAVNVVEAATGRAAEAGAGRVIGAVLVERP